MRISTKGRYGLRAMVDLAVHSGNGHVSLLQIAQRQKISLNYLEQVFSNLRRAGLVNSIKGAGGGYLLNRAPEDITVKDILNVLEGEYSIVDPNSVNRRDDLACMTAVQLIWDPINKNVNEFLRKTTLAQLAEEYQHLNGGSSDMYFI